MDLARIYPVNMCSVGWYFAEKFYGWGPTFGDSNICLDLWYNDVVKAAARENKRSAIDSRRSTYKDYFSKLGSNVDIGCLGLIIHRYILFNKDNRCAFRGTKTMLFLLNSVSM